MAKDADRVVFHVFQTDNLVFFFLFRNCRDTNCIFEKINANFWEISIDTRRNPPSEVYNYPIRCVESPSSYLNFAFVVIAACEDIARDGISTPTYLRCFIFLKKNYPDDGFLYKIFSPRVHALAKKIIKIHSRVRIFTLRLFLRVALISENSSRRMQRDLFFPLSFRVVFEQKCLIVCE